MNTVLILAALVCVAGWVYVEIRREVERMVDRLLYGDPAAWERIGRALERQPFPPGPAVGARINGHRHGVDVDWVRRRAA